MHVHWLSQNSWKIQHILQHDDIFATSLKLLLELNAGSWANYKIESSHLFKLGIHLIAPSLQVIDI